MDFLERLRAKPSGVKAQYAFGVAALITGLIGIIWVSTIPARFSHMPTKEVSKNSTSGISDFLSNTKNQLGNLIEGVDQKEEPTIDTKNMDALNMQDDGNGDSETTNLYELSSTTKAKEPTEENNVNQNPGIVMPPHISPKTIEPQQNLTNDGKRMILIEATTTHPKTVLVGTTTVEKP